MCLHKTFRTGFIFPSRSKWVQIVVCYDWNLQKHKYLSGISMFLHETFRTRVHLSEPVKMSPNSCMLLIETYKNINISVGISMFLHETFRTGLVFLSRSKWVQIVVCYDQNLQKHKYLSRISTYLHKTFRTGFIYLCHWLKWVQIVVCYDQNLQKHKYLSGISMFLCTKPSEQGSIFLSRSKWVQIVVCYWSKLTKT